MVIYTKTGDKGETGLFSKGKSKRISKSDPLIDAIGSVDEANSFIGIINSKLKTQKSKLKPKTQNLEESLHEIQRDLFTIGAMLAGAPLRSSSFEGQAKKLEKEIDVMEKKLPKLTNFILPGGSEVSAHLMYARALVRRAERRIVENLKLKTQNSKLQLKTQNSILQYINRLSDYLFVLARWENYISEVKETEWKV